MRLPPTLQSRRAGVIAAGVLVLVALIASVPISVQAELGAGDQGLAAAQAHRATVDAAMALFLSASDPNQSQDPDAIRTESDRRVSLYGDALAELKSDRARLKQAADALGWLEPVAFSSGSRMQTARRRAQGALDGLAQAADVLAAAIDQELLGRGVFEATLKENDMLDAMRMGQDADAHRIDAQADKSLRAAESRAAQPDQPPDVRLLVHSLRQMVDATDQLATARLRNDSQDQQLRQNQLQDAIRDFTRLSSERQLAAFRQWTDRTYHPKIAAYDAALSQF